jgi:hypothetical protein
MMAVECAASKCRKALMPECQKIASPESTFLHLVIYVSPASAFRHWCQSDTTGHGLVRHCPTIARVQGWANLDQAHEDLDRNIFRDLSPTPKP